MTKHSKDDASAGLGGVLGAIEKLAKLADELQNAKDEFNREGEIDLGKNSKASYRFRVRTLGDVKRDNATCESLRSDFKPFEKSASPKQKSTATAHSPIVEPETDVFIEGDVVVVYAQFSGVTESDIFIEPRAEHLELRAKNAAFLYQKKLFLPTAVLPESLMKSYKNGILEVRLAIDKNA